LKVLEIYRILSRIDQQKTVSEILNDYAKSRTASETREPQRSADVVSRELNELERQLEDRSSTERKDLQPA
jgi:hypothetical protein